jgi:hypothetical protein
MIDANIKIDPLGMDFQYVITDNEDGISKSFPVDPTNPEYIAFLAQLEAETE